MEKYSIVTSNEKTDNRRSFGKQIALSKISVDNNLFEEFATASSKFSKQ